MSGSLSASDVNASIPLQAGQGVQQVNPLQQIGQFADTANTLNQLKLFPGQQQLQQQAIQRGGIDVQQARQNFIQSQRAMGYGSLVPLLSLPAGQITHEDVTNALGGYEASGGVSQPIIADLLKEAPMGDGPEYDARVRALVAANSQTSPEAAVSEVTPQATMINNGSALQPATITPAGQPGPGAINPIGPAIPLTMSPESLNSPVTWKDSNGNTVQGTEAQYLEAVQGGQVSGLGSGTTPTAPPAAARPTASAGWGGFSYPATALNPSTTIASGLPEQQKNSTDMFNGDTNSVANASKTLTNLQSIVAEGANAGTGALSDTLMKLGSTAQQLGLANGEQATDLQLIGKNVSQAVQSSLGGMGVPTDAKMGEIVEGTPNATMTPDAIKTAAAQLQGGIQWKQAELAAFQQYQTQAQKEGLTIGPGAYAQFNAQWQQRVPVAAFQLGGMPATQRAQYLKSLSRPQAYAIYQAQQQLGQWGLAPQ